MRSYFILILAGCFNLTFAQTPYGDEPLAHTFSIVARDSVTGEMGVAVQSHWFSVGTIVSWGEAGVGVVATQASVNVSFGPRGLALLKAGLTAQQALDALLEGDAARSVRQVAILDVKGNVAAYTGDSCIQYAGDQKGKQYSCQANLMRNAKVWPAMAKAYENAQGPLADRLMAALDAGQEAGGDIRGKQSAAILVVAAKSTGRPWIDRIVDLQIADYPEPLKEMRRLLKVHAAYEYMNRGDLAMEHKDVDAALASYGAAEAMFPDNEEMQYWHAIALANIGRLNDALGLFKSVFIKNPDWRELTPRIVKAGLLHVDKADLERIMNLK